MRAVQIAAPGAPFEVVTREIPEPKAGEVRIRVQACGVCHSDSLAAHGGYPGLTYPIVPGHEIVGIVDAIGPGAEPWRVGQRVGVGWFGGCDRSCKACRRGDFLLCEHAQVPGITRDGGYADYVVAQALAVAAVPNDLASAEAAPLLCAGITTFNALRHSGAVAGDVVAVLGLGGLGHLGVQFAAKQGFETVAIARGADKGPFAKQLGAQHYIDSTAENVAEALQQLGGAKVILATVTSADAMTNAFGGLGANGTMLIVGASMEPLKVAPLQLINGRKSIKGWPSGIATDSEDTLRFAARTGVRPLIERYPLERAAEAFERMMSGKARFRVVLETGA
jgi:D-arabinose 1-dehydrogenase-like Zn-dependent alcohol dehydrogenase